MHNSIVSVNKKAKRIASLLFVIAIILILYGLFLDFTGEDRLIDPVKDVSTVDVNNNKSQVNVDVDSIQSDNNIKPNPITDQSKEKINKAKTEVKQDESKYDESEIDSVNKRLESQVEKRYGIDVKFGAETEGYKAGELEIIPITDPNAAHDALYKLNIVLGHYPDNLFYEIKNGGIPLTIYLVDKFSQAGITGVTDSNAYYANISIATAYPFEESFYHESYHYIERYMMEKKKLYYNSWDSLNPPGFTYTENPNPSISYAANGGEENSYFVNNYAQTADAEDRASTFEYMMANTKAKCLNKDKPVWKKAKLMAQTIDAALDSCSPSIVDYWERFL